MIVEIAPHERKAMQEIVLVVRAFASMLGQDTEQVARMLNWAQMLEDVVDRLE